MRVRIIDADALRTLSLVDIRSYLASQNWQSAGRYGDVATIYQHSLDGAEAEILLPIRETLADLPARLTEIISTLADVERRDELSVFRDLVFSGFDVVRFRAPGSETDGTIALQSGVALYDNARDVVAAAANAEVKRSRVFRGNTSEKAKVYLDSLRLGQTEIGSYILTVLSPVRPGLESDQSSLFPDIDMIEEPFSRKATRRLASALQAAKNAVEEAGATGRFEPFEVSVKDGVSSNLCEAIAKLVEQGDGVDIGLTWSRVRLAPQRNLLFKFTTDNARLFTEAAASLRAREPESNVTIQGIVTSLSRDPENFDGKAKITGFINGEAMTVSGDFLHADYQLMVQAHDKKTLVQVEGDLIKRGNTKFLERARNLKMIVLDEQ